MSDSNHAFPIRNAVFGVADKVNQSGFRPDASEAVLYLEHPIEVELPVILAQCADLGLVTVHLGERQLVLALANPGDYSPDVDLAYPVADRCQRLADHFGWSAICRMAGDRFAYFGPDALKRLEANVHWTFPQMRNIWKYS